MFKKETVIDIISNEVITNNKQNVSIGKRIIKTVKVFICAMCYMPTKKIIKCSGKKCDKILCKGCITYIGNTPLCNDCVVDIVRNKSLLIIIKGQH